MQNFIQPRLRPLGNTFLNCDAGNDVVEPQALASPLVRRRGSITKARSVPEYIPHEFLELYGCEQEKDAADRKDSKKDAAEEDDEREAPEVPEAPSTVYGSEEQDDNASEEAASPAWPREQRVVTWPQHEPEKRAQRGGYLQGQTQPPQQQLQLQQLQLQLHLPVSQSFHPHQAQQPQWDVQPPLAQQQFQPPQPMQQTPFQQQQQQQFQQQMQQLQHMQQVQQAQQQPQMQQQPQQQPQMQPLQPLQPLQVAPPPPASPAQQQSQRQQSKQESRQGSKVQQHQPQLQQQPRQGSKKSQQQQQASQQAQQQQQQQAQPQESGARRNSWQPQSSNSPTVAAGKNATGRQPRRAVTAPTLATAPGSEAAEGKEGESPQGPVTTLMIRNLPQDLQQSALAEELDLCGFSGLYDCLYMPSTFATGRGKGYAFVNFISPEAACGLIAAWHFTCRPNFGSTDLLNVSAACLQGREANLARWDTSKMRRIRNPNHRPLIFLQAGQTRGGSPEKAVPR